MRIVPGMVRIMPSSGKMRILRIVRIVAGIMRIMPHVENRR